MKIGSSRRKQSPTRWILGGFGVFFLVFSVIIGVSDWASYKQNPPAYPLGLTINGIPMGGLDRPAAEARLLEAFGVPVELVYQGARVQLAPQALGFSLDLPATFGQLDEKGLSPGWWAHLWGKTTKQMLDVPAVYAIDEGVLKATLEQTFTPRYDQPATAALPVIGSTAVNAGQAGWKLASLEEAAAQTAQALASPSERTVVLSVSELAALPMDTRNLEIQLKQLIKLEGFNDLAEVYFQDLQSYENFHIAVLDNQDVPPDVAYSAASTIKIPIMLSALRRLDEPLPQLAADWMRLMLTESLNSPADGLMKTYLDANQGPLVVTSDLVELGYQNTFLAGYFEPGSPLLKVFKTPANSRSDIFLDPDTYNQTVPSEIGSLLERVYRCAGGMEGGALFGGQVSQAECQSMLALMQQNKIGALIEAGVPYETPVAHKHGWTTELDGLLHAISDVGVVYSPARDYVLVIFIHSPQQLFFDTQNRLFAKLSQCIYNSINPEHQAAWLGE